ncbi:MAG TPA: glycosyltransferase family 4 protein [Vicinamibacterales bacterium]|nr:glycosyltransferase family 4 protein [Vicinamibacterales bacterium]
MRIAITSWSNRRFGGTGTYLTELCAGLLRQGHQVAWLHERDAPTDHPRLETGSDGPVWCIESLGQESAIAALRAWNPDVLFAHGFLETKHEQAALDIAPAVFLAHDYYGTCISGLKAHSLPTVQPCHRTLGWQCLASYHVRRCGGLSPVTMVREFRRQSNRLELLRRYKAIVTLSDHMREEYLRHGFEPSRVVKVAHSVGAANTTTTPSPSRPGHDSAWRLLFVGRMYTTKGGRELIDALPKVVRELQRRCEVTFAGDGAQRREWEARAGRLSSKEPMASVKFAGWLQADALAQVYANTDLVVVPSLWPEPFGLVGLEAGMHGIPAAAFAVGGIPEWLQSGVNGHLASGSPPTSDGLADAIVACLRDEETRARLGAGARRLWSERKFERHIASLLDVFAVARHAA